MFLDTFRCLGKAPKGMLYDTNRFDKFGYITKKSICRHYDNKTIISVHDSIIIILSFGTLLVRIRPWMAAQQSIL